MSVLDGSFKDISIIEKVETQDELGGFMTTYKKINTIKGLLTRASYSERTIASQSTIEEVFTLMTKDKNANIKKDNVVIGFGKVAIITSEELESPIQSETMKDIRQWTCKTYPIPRGAVIE